MNPLVRVRLATFDDIETIAAIHTEARTAYYRGYVPDAELRDPAAHVLRRDAYRDRVRAPEYTVLCAERGGRVLGFTLFGPPSVPEPGSGPPTVAQLRQIHVDPAHWRLGIGSALHDACVRAWQAAAITVGRVDVWRHDHHALSFYDAHGWRPESQRGQAHARPGYLHLTLAVPQG
jgi:ribosomal protein S18 acetylase RimI-like enzyme